MTLDATVKAKHAGRVKSGARRVIKRLMTYLLLIMLAWFLVACVIQRSILFPRSMIEVAGYPGPPGHVEVLFLESSQGGVEAWFILGEGASAQTPGPVVIFAHGNGELIDHWPGMLQGYIEMGVSVLLPEFRGYGRSAGDPSQDAIGEDFARFYDLVIKRPQVDPDRVVLHGRSIGGGVAAQLASDRPSAAMILQSSPSSIKRMAVRFLVPWFLVRDPFDAVRVLRDYTHPVLVMHGSADRIVSPSHAHRLAQASKHPAPASRLIFYDVDHNTLPPSGPYWRDIKAFLKDAGVLE